MDLTMFSHFSLCSFTSNHFSLEKTCWHYVLQPSCNKVIAILLRIFLLFLEMKTLMSYGCLCYVWKTRYGVNTKVSESGIPFYHVHTKNLLHVQLHILALPQTLKILKLVAFNVLSAWLQPVHPLNI